MAKYDQGGGCACGLYRECLCWEKDDPPNNYITKAMRIDYQARRKAAKELPPLPKKEIFDFGFTIAEEAPKVDDRAERMFDAIMPLLENLKKNPEIDTIKWPNRVQKIEEFQSKLAHILNGTD